MLDRCLSGAVAHAFENRPLRDRRRALRPDVSKAGMNYVATIVIPLKRQQDAYLAQCVRSAVEQSAPCEVLVVRAADTPASNVAILEDLARDYPNLCTTIEQ